jgi:hypothetical protein
MRQREFEERVKMSVSVEEFNHINEVYMASDVDKDEFCRLWVKMNHTRVRIAKLEYKRQQEQEKRDGVLWFIWQKHINKSYQWKIETLCKTALKKREMKALEESGIDTTYHYEGYRMYNNMNDILRAIGDRMLK